MSKPTNYHENENFPRRAITDAPALRESNLRACWNCKFFERVEGDYCAPQGKCTQFDFESHEHWVCDEWAEPEPAPMQVEVVNVSGVDGETLSLAADSFISLGEELKSLEKQSDLVRVGAYGIRFGAPNEKDLLESFFASDTDYGPHNGDGVVTMFNHGIAAYRFWEPFTVRTYAPVRATKDQFGIFVESVLNLADEYERAIYETVEQRKVKWSSGTAKHMILSDKRSGKVLRWHPLEWSYTPIPAEPRLPPILPLKSLTQFFVTKPATAATSGGGVTSAKQDAPVRATVSVVSNTNSTKSEETMSEEIQAQLAEMKANWERVTKILERFEKEPALANGGFVTQDGGGKDKNIKNFADFLLAIKRGDNKRLVTVYATRQATRADDADTPEMRALAEGSGATGGYLVPTEYVNELLQVAAEEAIVRRHNPYVHPMAARTAEIPYLDQSGAPPTDGSAFFGGVVGGWTDEAGSISETTPAFKMLKLNAHKLALYTKASSEVNADSAQALEALLKRLFGGAIAWQEDYSFLRANGVGKPLGVLNAPCKISVTRNAGGNSFEYTDVKNMIKRLPASSIKSAVWVMHQFIIADLMDLQQTNNTLITWLNGLVGGVPTSLLGIPIEWTEKQPAPGTAGDVMLCDFRYYVIGDRKSIDIAYSEHAFFTTDQVAWRVTHRVDGQPWLQSAITLADGSNTVSPFVVLN